LEGVSLKRVLLKKQGLFERTSLLFLFFIKCMIWYRSVDDAPAAGAEATIAIGEKERYSDFRIISTEPKNHFLVNVNTFP